MYKGIDVSAYQEDINWETVKNSGIEFAILRVGVGSDISSQDDVKFIQNADECTRIGIPFGVYLFSYADTYEKINSEVEHTLRLISGYKLDYPVFLDLEDNNTSKSVGQDTIADFAKIYCTRIKDAGYYPAIYASKSWFTGYLTNEEFNNWDKWVACYYYDDERDNNVNSEDYNNTEYKMWQYSSHGSVDGICKRTDMNYCYVDYPSIINGQSSIDADTIDGIIKSAYNDILKRDPDECGAENYRNCMLNGMTEDELRNGLRSCDEAKNKFAEIVTSAYNDILHRDPDVDGLGNYVNCMVNGYTEDDVRNGLASSEEAQNIRQAEIETKRQFVRDCYDKYLGRGASEDEVDLYMGMELTDIENSISNSEEANNHRAALAQAEADRIAFEEEQKRLAEEQRKKIEEEKIAEQNRLAEIERQRLAEEEKLRLAQEAQQKIDAENARLAEIERIKSDAQTELDTSLSSIWTGFYTAQKDENTGLYSLTETNSVDESRMSAGDESQRVAQKDAYDKYNNIILDLNKK